jgi:hypothetical protein
MTDDSSTPGSGFDSASWLVRDQEFVKLCKSTLSENKTALFDALANARIGTVKVTFNGYADSGQVDEAVIDGEGADADLRLIDIEISRVGWGSPAVVRETRSVKDAIEKLVYDLLLAIHSWFDASKLIMADFRHRALRHHAEGIFLAETVFGPTITLSSGRVIPTRWVGEQHVVEDLGFIPSFADWVKCIRPEPWMGRAQRIEREVEPPHPLARTWQGA